MNILSRYVLRKFLKPFITSFAALCIIIFVSQLFERLDRFLADGVSFGHVAGFLLTSLPYQALQVLPVSCLLATLFVVGDLARNREYIAGLAGGIPPEKLLSGIVLAGFFISLGALVINETIVPPTARYARRVFQEDIRRLGEFGKSVFSDLFVPGLDGRMWNARQFNQASGRIDRVIVDTYAAGQMQPQIDAESAQWNEGEWKFYNGVIRSFKPDGLNVDKIQPFTVQSFPFGERPSDLVTQEPEPAEMNSKTLKNHIVRLESLGVPVRKLQVEHRMKLAFPFACFVVTVLGIPLAMKGRGSKAMGIAAAGALTLLYMGFMQFGKALAQRLVDPMLGAWLGNIVFLALAVILWMRMRRTA